MTKVATIINVRVDEQPKIKPQHIPLKERLKDYSGEYNAEE